MRSRFWSLVAVTMAAAFAHGTAGAVTCEALTGMPLRDGRVVAAVSVPGPTLTVEGMSFTGVPPFCKVSAVATPTPDSLINVEVWLPDPAAWNGRFEGIGNGGYAGTLAAGLPAMVVALKRQFAVAGTDMGTAPSSNNNADALVGHPQKWEDWGHRATHLMTGIGKELVGLRFGRPPVYSYFNGCSTGGQQALMTAQRYPQDYEGILSGASAHNRTHTHSTLVWNFQAQRATLLSSFSSDQVKLVTAAVASACAAKSGGLPQDGFLTDPRTCNWDPAELQCSSALATNCLNADQVAAARRIYAGATNPVTGQRIASGSTRGAETDSLFGWQSQGRAEPSFGSLFKWVFGLAWQGTSFDFAGQMDSVDSLLGPMMNANNPDLSSFRTRGGKLMAYHGTSDPLIPVQETINYYHRAVQTQNGSWQVQLHRTRQFFRLFVVPGMTHCAAGPGPNAFGNLFSGTVLAAEPPSVDGQHDAMTALMNWVEGGIAPDSLVATKYVQDQPALGVESQRPICAYPLFPKYTGTGDTKVAANFVCADNGNSAPALNPMPADAYLR